MELETAWTGLMKRTVMVRTKELFKSKSEKLCGGFTKKT